MSEETKTMSEWIDLHLAERRFHREARKMIKAGFKFEPTRKVKAAAPTPPPSELGPVELSDNPTHSEVAYWLGITDQQLTDELGGMSFEQLCQRLNMEPKQVAECLQLMSWAGSKPVALRIAVAKLKRYGVRACYAQASRQADRKEQRINAAAKLKAMSRKLRG